jgi:hypothetical protein
MVGASGTPCVFSRQFSLGPCGDLTCLGLGVGACPVQVETIASLSKCAQKVKRPTSPSVRSDRGAPDFISESALRAHHPRLAPAAKEHPASASNHVETSRGQSVHGPGTKRELRQAPNARPVSAVPARPWAALRWMARERASWQSV